MPLSLSVHKFIVQLIIELLTVYYLFSNEWVSKLVLLRPGSWCTSQAFRLVGEIWSFRIRNVLVNRIVNRINVILERYVSHTWPASALLISDPAYHSP